MRVTMATPSLVELMLWGRVQTMNACGMSYYWQRLERGMTSQSSQIKSCMVSYNIIRVTLFVWPWHFYYIKLQTESYIDSRSLFTNCMMTSSDWNIFRVTGPLWGESTGDQWIPLTKASDAELLCFLWSAPEHMGEQTIKRPVIWNAFAVNMAWL